MDLQAILDRISFRPEPAETLAEAIDDLRTAVTVLDDALDGPAPEPAAVSAAMHASRERIRTCHGIIAAHGFGGPIVEGTRSMAHGDVDWTDIGAIAGGASSGAERHVAFDRVRLADPAIVRSRLAADRLAVLEPVPDRLADVPAVASFAEAHVLVAGMAYLFAGFGTHPDVPDPDADRVVGGCWVVASVLLHTNGRHVT